MKKYLSFLSTVIVILTGCDKTSPMTGYINDNGADITELRVNLDSFSSTVSTKAAGSTADNEKLIHNVQVFIFRKGGAQDGLLDAARYVSLSSPVSGSYNMDPLKCTVGERQCMVIVNAPQDYTSSISSLAELQAKTFTLADCVTGSTQKLVMVGTRMEKNSQEVTKFEPGELSVTVKVSRLVSAVNLTKVINKMQVPALQSKVKFTGAYLMNVAGLQNYAGTLKASVSTAIPDANWYAKNKKASGSEPAFLLLQAPASAQSIAYGDTGITPGYLMYSLPSDIGGAVGTDERVEGDGTGFRTSTYLIVEATVDDKACVYPILLPQLEANKKYNVTLTINHMGGDPTKPWEKIKFTDFSANINVVDWTNVEYNETI